MDRPRITSVVVLENSTSGAVHHSGTVGVDDIWLIVAPMLRFRSICGRCAICTIANITVHRQLLQWAHYYSAGSIANSSYGSVETIAV